MEQVSAIQLKGITKRFGRVVANDGIDLEVRRGEILSLLGENGSGKTTLMNMISGIYFPDEGHICVGGREVTIRSPKDAYALGIGMIHQHFKLVDVFTAAQNIVLGLEGKGAFDLRAAARRVKEISEKYGFDIDPGKKVYDMSVSEKQTVEILKVLYRGADILILDEPTAVLTPQETEKLFAVLRNMRADGKAIVIITHKLHEVMALSDRVAVLRKGKYIGTVHTADTDPQKLTEMMVGRAVSLNIDRPEAKYRDLRLEVKGLTCRDHEGVKTLDDVSFQAFGGEILGIAGIAGSGQKELLEAIAGLQAAEAGSVLYYPPHPNSDIAGYHVPVDRDGEELVGKTPMQIRRVGVSLAFVPEDRLGMGLVAGMDMVDNMMLKTYREHKGPFVDRKAPRALAQRLIDELEIVTPGRHPGAPALRRQRAEGAGGPGDRLHPHRAYDRLPRPGPGHQLVLHHLRPAQPAEDEGRGRDPGGGGSGRAAGAVRPDPGTLRRQGLRHRGRPEYHKGRGGPLHDPRGRRKGGGRACIAAAKHP